MHREQALKVVMVLVGLLFVAAVYPLIGGVLHTDQSDTGDTMMMSLYFTLGVFLLLAVRNPSARKWPETSMTSCLSTSTELEF